MVMAVCMGIICMSGCDSKDISGAQEEKINITEKGNDESNMQAFIDGGLITEGDGKIYYLDLSKSGSDYRRRDLVMMNKDGEQKEVICSFENKECCLNYMNGYFYYVMQDEDLNDAVMKMKADGSKKERLFKVESTKEGYSNSITQMVVLKDKIIWKKQSGVGIEATWYLYDLKRKTNDPIKYDALEANNGEKFIGYDRTNVVFEENWFYYCKRYETDKPDGGYSEIRRAHYDGTEDNVILDGENLSLYGKIGDNIVYSIMDKERVLSDQSVLWNKKFEIYDVATKNSTNFFEDEMEKYDDFFVGDGKLISINIWKDQIYYVLLDVENQRYELLDSIHQIDISTGEDQLIYKFDEKNKVYKSYGLNDIEEKYQFVDGWLYLKGYSDKDCYNRVSYRIKLDGTVIDKLEIIYD